MDPQHSSQSEKKCVENNAALPIEGVQVGVVKYSAQSGRAISQSKPLLIRGAIESGKRGQVSVGVRINDPQETRFYKVAVEAAKLIE